MFVQAVLLAFICVMCNHYSEARKNERGREREELTGGGKRGGRQGGEEGEKSRFVRYSTFLFTAEYTPNNHPNCTKPVILLNP